MNHMEVSANIPQVGWEEMAVIVNHPEVLPSQKSKEKVINWLGVQEEAVEVFKKQEIDEEMFKEQLFYLKNSETSIKKMVRECLEMKPDYKIIRCLGSSIEKAKEKVSLFHLLHELALESSKLDKHMEFKKRLGLLIVSLLPRIKNFLPLKKIKKCTIIWIKERIFERHITNQLKRFDQSLIGSALPDRVESHHSQDGPVVIAQCNRDTSVVESQELSEPVKKRLSLDERLRRDFQIDTSENTP